MTMEGGTYMATISQMTGAARSIYTALYAGNSRTDATAGEGDREAVEGAKGKSIEFGV